MRKIGYTCDVNQKKFFGNNGLFVDFLCFTMHSPEATISAGRKELAFHNIKYRLHRLFFYYINYFDFVFQRKNKCEGRTSLVSALKAEFTRQRKRVAKML